MAHERKVVKMSDPTASVSLNEYIVACYGTTEYPEDMTPVRLVIDGEEKQEIAYEYKCREAAETGAKSVYALIPPIETKVSLDVERKGEANVCGYIKEGYAFSPMFTLGYTTQMKEGEVVKTWLSLEKAN